MIVVEDGTGLPNSESYISVADSDDYFSRRLYSEDWDTSSPDDKEKALVFATRRMDLLVYWNGLPKKLIPGVQALGWPRVPELIESQWGNPVPNYLFWRNLAWPYDQVPLHVKWATCELAMELLRADRTLEADTKGIKSLGVGQGAVSITFDSADRKATLPDAVVLMVKPFGTLIGKVQSSVNVVR